MANWISITAAAEKYGTTEEVIRSLVRLRYINFSIVDEYELVNIDNNILMVDADSINTVLDWNIVEALEENPDDKSIVRIPLVDLNGLFLENEEGRKQQEELLDELNAVLRREAKHKKLLKELSTISSQVIDLQLTSMQQIKEIIEKEDDPLLSFFSKIFRYKKTN